MSFSRGWLTLGAGLELAGLHDNSLLPIKSNLACSKVQCLVYINSFHTKGLYIGLWPILSFCEYFIIDKLSDNFCFFMILQVT